uniref:Aldehyde dehydrogenase domain-containing protein n=1 Tax=Micromonas pusilla TaxID=38833 RepID=A0A7S0NMS9_MICPS
MSRIGHLIVFGFVYAIYRLITHEWVPQVDVELTKEEKAGLPGKRWKPGTPFPKDFIPCYDPGTLEMLGPDMPADNADEVRVKIERARIAQKKWAKSSFKQRRLLIKTIQRFVLENQDTICKVSARDSGKPLVDAAFGEVIVTLEKCKWLIKEGEKWLKPEKRSSGLMMFYKNARVEYHPVGVMGAIVPWNYPFHNVFNPLLANVFAGNALVVKVSEYASWSSLYYGRAIKACLAAVGAPEDLVQIVHGYGEAGNALVTGGTDKVVFVGSTGVGRMVMKAAADTLTPVVLELGGKDPFIVLEDASLSQCVPMALRGAFQSCGQNCAGAERFYVHEKIHDKFVARVMKAANQLRQGWALAPGVDCGAMCMPNQAAYVQSLVDDAVAKGAKVECGGEIDKDAPGQFYPPTVLTNVNHSMKIMKEEVFGPVLSIVKVRSDDEAVALANECDFGLGSNVFGSTRRALEVGSQLNAGMTTINDFCATYMAQSLPFGGVKESGFDRFAGIEGLRGCCNVKSVVVDGIPGIRTDIPPPLQYPVQHCAFPFCKALCHMFFGLNILENARGLLMLVSAMMIPTPKVLLKGAKKD